MSGSALALLIQSSSSADDDVCECVCIFQSTSFFCPILLPRPNSILYDRGAYGYEKIKTSPRIVGEGYLPLALLSEGCFDTLEWVKFRTLCCREIS